MRYLAIDYGERRMGLAICDPMEILSSPYRVLDQPERLLEELEAIIRREAVEALVVGLPINMDGSEGFQARAVRSFVNRLANQTDLPIYFQDERLSTYAAREKLKQAKGRARKKKDPPVDALAAAEILSTFLENKPRQAVNDDTDLQGKDIES